MPAKKKHDERGRDIEQALWRKGLAGKMDSADEQPHERVPERKYPLTIIPRKPTHIIRHEEVVEYDPASERRTKIIPHEPIDVSPSRVSARKKDALALYSPRRTAVVPHHGFERHTPAHVRSDFEREVLHGISKGMPLWQLMHAAHTPAERRQLENLIAHGKFKRPGFRSARSDVNLNELRARAEQIIASRKPIERIKKWRRRVRDYLRK